MLFNIRDPIDLLYLIPAIIIALTVHEFSHGFAAYKMGDSTARDQGRLTLNPLKHIDIFGGLMLLFAGFGWAKPVGVNPMRFKKPKTGMALTALAGPLSNLISAFIFYIIFIIVQINMYGTAAGGYIAMFLATCISINIGLGVFNLIPFPPLDGSRILALFLPENVYFKIMRYERYTQFVLIILLFTGLLTRPLTYITGHILNFIGNLAAGIVSLFL